MPKAKWCLLSMIVHTSKYTFMTIASSAPRHQRALRGALIPNLIACHGLSSTEDDPDFSVICDPMGCQKQSDASQYTIRSFASSAPSHQRALSGASISNLIACPGLSSTEDDPNFSGICDPMGCQKQSDASYPWSFIRQNILLGLLLAQHLVIRGR
jgi:hypothetical protein